jgi:hypothetical protein
VAGGSCCWCFLLTLRDPYVLCNIS